MVRGWTKYPAGQRFGWEGAQDYNSPGSSEQSFIGRSILVDTSQSGNIKSQVTKHEITIKFLDPSGFETIAIDANIWKKLINGMARST